MSAAHLIAWIFIVLFFISIPEKLNHSLDYPQEHIWALPSFNDK